MKKYLINRLEILREYLNNVIILEAHDRKNNETHYRLSLVSSCSEKIYSLLRQKTIKDKDILKSMDDINNIIDEICYILYPHIENGYIKNEYDLLETIILFNYDTMIKYYYNKGDYTKAEALKNVKRQYKKHFPFIFDEEYMKFK